jgi:hypothetical protein
MTVIDTHHGAGVKIYEIDGLTVNTSRNKILFGFGATRSMAP